MATRIGRIVQQSQNRARRPLACGRAATFAGLDVKHAASAAVGETPWFIKALIGIVFSLVLVMLGGLVYFVWRFAAGPKVNEEALSV